MRKYISVLTITLVFVNFYTQAQIMKETPLNSYLKIAAENNPELKSIFNQYMAALERLPQARALPDPTVVFSVFTSPVETRVGAQQAGISLNQAFPWFGQLKSQETAVTQLAKARFEFFEDKKNELFFNVRNVYYDLYVLEAAISITEENIGLLKSFQELANVRLESGKGGAVDLLRVEMELAELENDLSFLKDSRLPIQTKFFELLNTEEILDIRLPDTLSTIAFEESKKVLLDSVLMVNPSLKKFDFEINALESEIDVAKKMGLPSFNLGLSYTNVKKRSGVDLPDNGKDVFIFPRIGLRLPLYRRKYHAMVKEREFLKSSKSNEKENRINQLTTKLEKAWRDYRDAERRVELYLNLIKLANQSLNILAAQYTSAGTEFEEMLRMDRKLLRYELELEKARADQNTSVAFINYLTGKNL